MSLTIMACRATAAKRLIRYLRIVCRDESVLVSRREAAAAAGIETKGGIDGLMVAATLLEPRIFEADEEWYIDHRGIRTNGARLGLRAPMEWDKWTARTDDGYAIPPTGEAGI